MSCNALESVVKFYEDNNGHRCGYCKSSNTNFSHGMWAYELSVQDYQDMIDRGWRRSGKYCYKPTMNITCCPMYTIKCSALDFKLSKSQKKKIKRFNNFLANGRCKVEHSDSKNDHTMSNMESGDDDNFEPGFSDIPNMNEKVERAQSLIGKAVVHRLEQSSNERVSDRENISQPEREESKDLVLSMANPGPSLENTMDVATPAKKTTRPGDGMDPNKPNCKKAKLMRLERKQKKTSKNNTSQGQEQKVAPPAKTVDDFINEPQPENPAHRLQIKLMSVKSLAEKEIMHKSWVLFSKYQMAVHNETPNECDMSTFINFLVDSPLKPYQPKSGPTQGYGSFHQQYWLDDRLIAVGVIDILPFCVSSVYFFYDPDFHFLVLGTYGSLREISFCRSLNQLAPSLKYYYMGFYIHSCPKMRYKGSYSPSFLLCPETYAWHPIESCIPLLEKNKYSRLNENPDAKDIDEVVSLDNVSVLFHNKAMLYKSFMLLNRLDNNLDEVTQYAELVGNKLSQRMLLIIQ